MFGASGPAARLPEAVAQDRIGGKIMCHHLLHADTSPPADAVGGTAGTRNGTGVVRGRCLICEPIADPSWGKLYNSLEDLRVLARLDMRNVL